MRRPPFLKPAAARKEFNELIKQDLRSPFNSSWSSSLHLVPNRNGERQAYRDYRRLNDQTIPDRYPIPLMQDFAHYSANCSVFLTLDLTEVYRQIPVVPEDISNTAICTPFRIFEFIWTFVLIHLFTTFSLQRITIVVLQLVGVSAVLKQVRTVYNFSKLVEK